MATRFAGAYKVAVVNPVPVGTAAADFGANITLIPDVSVDTQDHNSYIDATTAGLTGWPGSLPHGSITFGVLTKAAAAYFTLGTQCTLTIAIP